MPPFFHISCIDLEKVVSVEEVLPPQPDPAIFNITCEDRVYQLKADNEATRKQCVTACAYYYM